MATMSIRGIEDAVVARLKQRARREGGSLNSVVVKLLEERTDQPAKRREPRTFDDLDALAGTWSASDAKRFAQGVAPFGEVDPQLWK